MDKKEQKAWKECLALWKKLSETPTQEIDSPSRFKNKVLGDIGIGHRDCGCPFCESYGNPPNCTGCPINGYYQTPYGEWELFIFDRDKHSKAKATKFYKYLLKRYEERKREDN